MEILTAKLEAEIVASEHPGDYLILEESPTRRGQWVVQSLGTDYLIDLKDELGSSRSVTPSSLNRFSNRAFVLGYKLVFADDPSAILGAYEHLNDPPVIELNSDLPGTIKGLLPYQLQGFNFLKDQESGVAMWSTGPQPLEEPVLTPAGWTPIGDLIVGDKIIGSNGKSATVTGVFPQGVKERVRVNFSDDTFVSCSSDHLWTVNYWSNGSRKIPNRRFQREDTLSIRDIVERGLYVKSGSQKSGPLGRAKFWLPGLKPVEFGPCVLPFDPYALGLLLGDGGLSHGVTFTTTDPELLRAFSAIGASVKYSGKHSYRINGIKPLLRNLDLIGKRSWEKFVPPVFLRGSVEDRLALLQGLLDTDGCVSGSGASFTSTSQQMAQDVAELCRSLGGIAKVPKPRTTFFTYKGVKKQGRVSYRVNMTLDMPLFRLARKEEARTPYRRQYKTIVGVDADGSTEMVCISVDAPDHLYVTRDYAITHNTGKTVLASALLKYHLYLDSFDLAWVVVKSHNKINTQRTFKRLADIDALVLDGPQKRREEVLRGLVEAPSGSVVITNYEKFRVDQDLLLPLFEKRVLIIWDEMPTKLKSRKSQLYHSVRKCLYKKVSLEDPRPIHTRQYMLSATPIENSPEDWFNCVRLMDPGVYGTIDEFRNEYVASYSPFGYEPASWRRLDEMGQVAAHMTHQVDKSDADIAAQFPEVVETPFYIDWDKGDRKVYDLLAAEARKKLEDRDIFDEQTIFGLIGVMEMMCCAPSMISNSAALRKDFEDGLVPNIQGSEVAARLQELLVRKLTDDKHSKLAILKSLITEDHPGEKIVLFSSYNESLLPILERNLKTWGVRYVKYGGSTAHKQLAQDRFQNDPTIQVFLSSDMGSDSISLEEASVVIHYNLPWKWATKIQRQNRAHRITSDHKQVRFYTLMMADSVEERKERILKKKKLYHEQVFKGEISEQSESARMTREDLLYILG